MDYTTTPTPIPYETTPQPIQPTPIPQRPVKPKIPTVILYDNEFVRKISKNYKSTSRVDNTLENITIPQNFNGKDIWNNILNPQEIQNPREGLFYIVKEAYGNRLNICSYKSFYVPDFSSQEMMIQISPPGGGGSEGMYQGYSIYELLEYILTQGITVDNCVSDVLLQKKDINLNTIKTPEDQETILKKYSPLLKKNVGCLYHFRQQLARRVFRIDGIARIGSETNSIQQNTLDIQTEIYCRGPIISGMIMYTDMTTWDGFGIYYGPSKNDKPIGGIPMVIIGWGIDKDTEIHYWLCTTPFGLDFGYFGKCKIKMGIVECQLEINAVTFYPEMPNNAMNSMFLSPNVKNRPTLVPGYFMAQDTLKMVRDTSLTGRFGTHDTSNLSLIVNPKLLFDLSKIPAGEITTYNYENMFINREQGNLLTLIFCLDIILLIYIYVIKK